MNETEKNGNDYKEKLSYVNIMTKNEIFASLC